jgi:membrane-associated HD superfamily phosphohydrolase
MSSQRSLRKQAHPNRGHPENPRYYVYIYGCLCANFGAQSMLYYPNITFLYIIIFGMMFILVIFYTLVISKHLINIICIYIIFSYNNIYIMCINAYSFMPSEIEYPLHPL